MSSRTSDSRGLSSGRPCERSAVHDLLGKRGLHLGRKGGIAAGDGDDRVADLLARGLLREVSARALGDRGVGQLGLHERGEEEHLGGVAVALESREHLRPLEARHADVEDRDVRLQKLDLLERVTAVSGLAHELEVGAILDRAHDALAIDGVIVGDQHADALRAGCGGHRRGF